MTDIKIAVSESRLVDAMTMLADLLSRASEEERQKVAKWLESAPGMAACARARIDLRLTEYLLDLSTATLEDHIRFVTQHGKLAAGASRDKRLKRVVDAKASIKGPKSLSLQLLADRGGKRTYELYLRFARRLKWSTESGIPEWDEYDDWKTHAPTQNERKLRWIRELDRHVTTSTDAAMEQLQQWPCHCVGQSPTAPEWVRRHPAFDRFIKETPSDKAVDAKSPHALYALWVKAPMAPEPFDIQLYVGLAKNGAGQRWQDGHIPDVRRVLQARGDIHALQRLTPDIQVVDVCLAVLAHQGKLTTDAYLMVFASLDTEAAMQAREKELRGDETLKLTDSRFGLNVV